MIAIEFLPRWRPELSVGIDEIDEQHQTICRLTTDIYLAINSEKPAHILDDYLGQLANYTRLHFSVEESLMRSLNYPGYDQHKKSHERLLDQCLEIRHKVNAGQMTRLQLLQFLGSWFSEHILHDDQDYGEHFQRVGVDKVLKRMGWMSHLWQWHANP